MLAANKEKERVLLQGRLDRVPYKQIGAKLGKTDLACRLHFHQMVMAKRTPQTQPGRSIVFLSSEHPPEVHHLAPTSTSLKCASSTPGFATSRDPTTTNDGCATMRQLHDLPHHRRSASFPYADPSHYSAWQPAASPYSSTQHRSPPGPVDLGRLGNIYREHAGDFWSTIAAKYSGGANLTPSELETAFLNARSLDDNVFDISLANQSSDRSDASFLSRDVSESPNLLHLRHVRSSSDMSIAGKCSVESLLNHGRI